MDIWYQCTCCGKQYPVRRLVKDWNEAPAQLPDICQWCNKGKYVKIKDEERK